MKKIHITILEEDKDYAEKLALALTQKDKEGIRAGWYSEPDYEVSESDRQETNLVLVGRRFWEEIQLQRIQKEYAHAVIALLSEDGILRELRGYPVVEKYQGVDKIIKEMYRLMAECDMEDLVYQGEQKQVIGVYAPWHQDLSMLFSIVLLQALAEKERFLYVSLQECLGRKPNAETWQEENLADFVSFLRKEKGSVQVRLKSICKVLGRGACIPAVDNPQNIRDMTREDYQRLWEVLGEQSEYGGILMEFSGAYPGMYEDMKRCQKIYCPYQEEFFVTGRREQLMHIFGMYEAEGILERMQEIRLPRVTLGGGMRLWTDEALAETLLYSEFGDVVRGLVNGYEG